MKLKELFKEIGIEKDDFDDLHITSKSFAIHRF